MPNLSTQISFEPEFVSFRSHYRQNLRSGKSTKNFFKSHKLFAHPKPPYWDAAFLLTVGSFLLTVELFYLQLTILAFLLTVLASLLTVLASLLTVRAFLLTVGKCV